MRGVVRDLIRGGRYGERSREPRKQAIVMGHHLTSGEGKGSKKIEFCNDPQHPIFF